MPYSVMSTFAELRVEAERDIGAQRAQEHHRQVERRLADVKEQVDYTADEESEREG